MLVRKILQIAIAVTFAVLLCTVFLQPSLYAQIKVKGGEAGSANSFSFVVSAPKKPRGTILKDTAISACWIDSATAITAKDKAKKKVKIKKTAPGTLSLKKLNNYKLPITITVKMPELYGRQIEKSSFASSILVPCSKKDKKCKKPKKQSLVILADGPNCLPDSVLPFDEEGGLSSGKLVLDAPAISGLYASGQGFSFHPEGVALSTSSPNITFKLNGGDLDVASYSIAADKLTVATPLREGRNTVFVVAQDSEGKDLLYESEIWAGKFSVAVEVRDPSGLSVDNANVVLGLADNKEISISGITSGGKVSFANIPGTSILIDVTTSTGLKGWAVGTPLDSPFVIKLKQPSTSSGPLNGDFNSGLTGWNFLPGTVSLVDHNKKTTQQALDIEQALNQSLQYLNSDRLGWKVKDPAKRFQQGIALQQKIENSKNKEQADPLTPVDLDMVVSTSGVEGLTTASHTFTLKSGTKSVLVKYRFITSEVPGGYYGSEYNDYFRVSMKALGSGTQASQGNSMNGLGLSEFDAVGATEWKELVIPVNQSGDSVEVEIGVANVGDGAYNSQVEVDFIEEKFFSITDAGLSDIDGAALSFLSSDQHFYFNGNTVVLGKVTLQGTKDHKVEDLALEVWNGNSLVARGELSTASKSLVLKKFDETEKIEAPANSLRFEIPSYQLAALDNLVNSSVLLKFRARTDVIEDKEAEFDIISVPTLSLFEGSNRYGGRDTAMGGDDWVKPSIKAFLPTFLTYGDFSNMNGGAFPPHASHRTGNSSDAWFNGYNARDAATATQIINIINAGGGRITTVYVTYSKVATDPFWNAIKNVSLSDGSAASSVIVPLGGHTTHFHMEISD